MRRLIAAGILLLIIITVCIAGNLTVSNICSNAAVLAEDGEKACTSKDWETAQGQAKQLSDYLSSRRWIMSLFVDHGDIEMLSSKASTLCVLAEEHDAAAFRERIREIFHLLETVTGEQRFNADVFV